MEPERRRDQPGDQPRNRVWERRCCACPEPWQSSTSFAIVHRNHAPCRVSIHIARTSDNFTDSRTEKVFSWPHAQSPTALDPQWHRATAAKHSEHFGEADEEVCERMPRTGR